MKTQREDEVRSLGIVSKQLTEATEFFFSPQQKTTVERESKYDRTSRSRISDKGQHYEG